MVLRRAEQLQAGQRVRVNARVGVVTMVMNTGARVRVRTSNRTQHTFTVPAYRTVEVLA